MSTKQTTVRLPMDLFKILYATIDGNSAVYQRVEVRRKGQKSYSSGITASNGLDRFLIVPQTK
jgi:hypothetical protein